METNEITIKSPSQFSYKTADQLNEQYNAAQLDILWDQLEDIGDVSGQAIVEQAMEMKR